VHALLQHLGLEGVTAVGWSMGAFVLWDYLSQFGPDLLASVVVVSQGPSDLVQPDWPYGIADVRQLAGIVAGMQDDFRGFFAGFTPLMFKDKLTPGQEERFVDAISEVGANAGTVIFTDQTLRDYRDVIPAFAIPHLLVWGSDEKVIQRGAGEWLVKALPHAEYVLFDGSGHCPMWEEAERFNQVVADWVARQ
jgi:pimeloyl-ACP methyl ester carboxylesterase